MENLSIKRPFDNFRTAITDPKYFFGRQDILGSIKRDPFQVLCLLGGRRIGKTSSLRNIEKNFLESGAESRGFPVFISLQLEQPDSINNLRYIMIDCLCKAMDRWRNTIEITSRKLYERFLKQIAIAEVTFGFLKVNLSNPTRERSLDKDDFRNGLLTSIKELQKYNFEGVIFLFDEAEYIVRQSWAHNAWSYFRALKDNDDALRSILGFIISGYRDVKEYQQRLGSPLLNIANLTWLGPLNEIEAHGLISLRCREEKISLENDEVNFLIDLSGCHPYLVQQSINIISNNFRNCFLGSVEAFKKKIQRRHDSDFSAWWNIDKKSDGFGSREREVYLCLAEIEIGNSETLSKKTKLSENEVYEALDILYGTGVISKVGEFNFRIGSRLFEEWIKRE